MRSRRGAQAGGRWRDQGIPPNQPEPRPVTLSELEVLQAISRAFGSSADVEEATASAVRWVRAAVGADDAAVRLFLSRPDGGLESALPKLEVADEPERLAERRRIFEGRRPAKAPVAGGQVLATLPLVSRGEAVGLLEVVAPAGTVEGRWATLEAVASQVAILFRNLAHTSRLTAGLAGLREMAGMASEIVRAGTPQDAVRAAVRFCHQRFGQPAVGWLTRGDPTRFELVSARGFGSEGRRALRSKLRVLRRADLVEEQGRREAVETFAELAGVPEADAAVAGDAVLLVGGPLADGHAPIRLVEGLLEDVLDHLALVAAAERRHERLDLGIALTAHEVRAPLVGALAIIERLLMEREDKDGDHQLLRRSQEQLEQLSRLVDALLRWAVAGQPLELRPTDLGLLVRDAVEWCARETGAERVTIAVPPAVTVLADPDHLRGAVANVIRNALVYSPPHTDVSVVVEAAKGTARVMVSDRGPGVPAGERDSIFDPFMRGSAAYLARSGNGLGLFIARRVLEAHGGAIWLSSNGSGATFTMELPTPEADLA
jgi:signal transduction histidine kinase